jgi:hypothetical protein
MDGAELSALITERQTILDQLLELGARQVDVIAAGRMSELMRILTDKQIPLQRLGEISERLRETADDDPRARRWNSQQDRDLCRQAQDDCERMHVELLAIEAQCETALHESRNAIQQELQQIDSAHQAASQYAHAEATQTAGIRLDLLSD